MDRVLVKSNFVYKQTSAGSMTLDVYSPPQATNPLPAILFIPGDASPETLRHAKDWRFNRSYGRLAAASGYAGIVLNHRSSENGIRDAEMRSDISDALKFVKSQARDHSIDPNRICLWFFSGSGPHLSIGMSDTNSVRCMVAYYPVLASRSRAPEFSSIEQLKKFAPNIPPILVAKAGREIPLFTSLVEAFEKAAHEKQAPLELLNHPTACMPLLFPTTMKLRGESSETRFTSLTGI